MSPNKTRGKHQAAILLYVDTIACGEREQDNTAIFQPSSRRVAMTSKRDFLTIAGANSALAASGMITTPAAYAAPNDGTRSGNAREKSAHYVPPVKFGLGGVPLGNEFEAVDRKSVV